jgi:hypothetical protein
VLVLELLFLEKSSTMVLCGAKYISWNFKYLLRDRSAMNIHGKCSLCGGLVTTPGFWGSDNPAVPTCQHCGAHKRHYLPTVDMEPASDRPDGGPRGELQQEYFGIKKK